MVRGHGPSAGAGRARAAALALSLTVALGVGACGGGEPVTTGVPAGDCRPLAIVATTSILGDVVGNVMGGRSGIEVLMPVGADPHSFQASAAQGARLGAADLVVMNGLGLEEGLHEVVEASAADGVAVVEVASFVWALPLIVGHDGEGGEDPDGDQHGSLDPHLWTDPRRMAEVATGLGEALAAADPTCAGSYRAAAAAYRRDLLALDAEIEAILAAVPPGQRKLVTSHHAFGYFADRYGFTVVGVIIPGGSTLAEPSPAHLAALVETLRREGVRAVFAETTQSADLATALAGELGEGVRVVSLFTGSLGGPGSGADTYLGMQRVNARRIADALAP